MAAAKALLDEGIPLAGDLLVAGVADEVGKALDDGEFGFVVTKIATGGMPAEWGKARLPGDADGVEDKYRLIRHIQALEGIPIHDVRFW